MSRIQDILSKAERDGTVRRTRALGDDYASRPADEGVQARAFVDSGPAVRTLRDEAPPVPDASRQPALRRPEPPLQDVASPASSDAGRFARQIEPAPEAGH